MPGKNSIFIDDKCRFGVTILMLNIITYGIVNNVLFTLFPLLGTELQMSAKEITLLGTLAALVIFLASPFWGRKSSEWGRRNTIVIGMSGFACAAFSLVLILRGGLSGVLEGDLLYGLLLVSRLAQAFLLAAMLPAATAYIIDVTRPEGRTVGLSRIGASHGIGSIIGPTLVSLSVFGLMVPIYVAVAVAVFMTAIIWRFLHEPDRPSARFPVKPAKMRYLDPRYREILAVGVVVYLSMAVSTQILGFYLPYVLGLGTQESAAPLAMTQGISACFMVFVQLFLIQRLQWSPMRYLIMGVPAIFAGFLFYCFASELWMLQVGAGFVGFGLGLTGPGYSAEVSLRVEPEEQGAVAGLISACPALGFVIGPLSAGVLYDIRPELPYYLTAVMLLLLFPVLLWVNRSRP